MALILSYNLSVYILTYLYLIEISIQSIYSNERNRTHMHV